MKNCNVCGERNNDNAKFCVKCGARLDNAVESESLGREYCINCGAELKDGAKFCSKCGFRAQSAMVGSPPRRQPLKSKRARRRKGRKIGEIARPRSRIRTA